MKHASRFSLIWFLTWAVAVIFIAGAAQANSRKEAASIQEDLVQEIENLEVINQLNAGQLDSGGVAIHGESKASGEAAKGSESHRTPQRSILSRR